MSEPHTYRYLSTVVLVCGIAGCNCEGRHMSVTWDLSRSHNLSDVDFPDEARHAADAIVAREDVRHATIRFPDDREFDEPVRRLFLRKDGDEQRLYYITVESGYVDADAAFAVVERLCAEFGVSMEPFYKWRRMLREDGSAGNESVTSYATRPAYTIELQRELLRNDLWKVRFQATWMRGAPPKSAGE